MNFLFDNENIKCKVNTYNGYPSCQLLGVNDLANTFCFYFSYLCTCHMDSAEMIYELNSRLDLVEGFMNGDYEEEYHDIGTDVDPVLISDLGIEFLDYKVGEVMDSCSHIQFLEFGYKWVEFIKTEAKNIDRYRTKWWDDFHIHQASQNLDIKESIQKAHRKDTFFKRLSNLFG